MTDHSPDPTEAVRRQLEPCIRMLASCLEAASDEVWDARDGARPPVWAQLYHTLFWLGAWLRDWALPLEHPAFHVKEALELRSIPEGGISREHMHEYFVKVEADLRGYLSRLSPQKLMEPTVAFGRQWTPLERILGQIRHVQHHVGYLNSTLRAAGCAPAAWVDVRV